MSTAIAKFDGVFTKSKKVRVVKYAAQVRPVSRRLRLAKFVKFTFAISFVITIICAIVSISYYSHALAAVEKRIHSGFWQTRSGIYAAARELKTGQQITTENLTAMLRGAGFVEGDNYDVWNGSYSVKGDSVEIHSNQENINVEIKNNRIAAISDGKNAVGSYAIAPQLLTGHSEAKRASEKVLSYDEIPANLKNAILATEDRRFFEHLGVDFQGVFRALYRNISSRELKQGGSTITQQLIKNTFLSSEKTFGRKFNEMFLAFALEQRMTKENIFALYCNEIYFGQRGTSGIHGVAQASREYFGKDLKDLSLTEAAAIAAMIKSPNRYAPTKTSEAVKERRDFVVRRMQEEGFINNEQEIAAVNQQLNVAPPQNENSVAPYFVDAVAKELPLRVSDDDSNMRVYTTIDPQIQEMAESSVAARLNDLSKIYAKKGQTPQATLVALDPKNGHVLAMVGGSDYAATQLNRATDAHRQPGSTFKPFVYAAALERGMTPLSLFPDKPIAVSYDHGKPYKPENYGDSYAMTDITMKSALAKSSNVVAVQLALNTGLNKVAETAKNFGLDKPQNYPSMALGTSEVTPLQLAAAYASFDNEGKRVKPVFISKIVSEDGDTVYQESRSDEQIVSPKTAYMITDMLSAVVERGTARSAKGALGKDVDFVGKTGSSNDGWFVGYTPNLVCVVWVGFDDNKDIKMTGGEAALPLWVDFMKSVTQTRPEYGGKDFPAPGGLVKVTIDPETGMIADDACPQRETIVVPATAVSNIKCFKHQHNDFEAAVAENSPESQTITPYREYVAPAAEAAPKVEPDVEKDKTEYKSVNGVPTKSDDVKVSPRKDSEEVAPNDDDNSLLRNPAPPTEAINPALQIAKIH